LALSVGEEIAIDFVRAGRWIAREGNARPGRGAEIAERHRLDDDGGRHVLAEPLAPAVDSRALGTARTEYRLDRAPQLRTRIIGDRFPPARAKCLYALDVVAQSCDRRIARNLVTEIAAGYTEDGRRIHPAEARPGVEREALVSGPFGKSGDRCRIGAALEEGI